MVPIFWSGFGFLIPLVTFVCMLITELGTEALLHDDQYYQTHGWPLGLGFLISAAALFALAQRLGRGGTRVLVDEATGERIEQRRSHSFFFIPMKGWAAALVVLGCIAPFLPR